MSSIYDSFSEPSPGWYIIHPEGSSWFVIQINNGGNMCNLVCKDHMDLHIAANDKFAEVCRAIKNEEVDIELPMDKAKGVIDIFNHWPLRRDDSMNPDMCVVERVRI